ncbi:hypothetical protein [Streptomyces chartreusis]
MLRGKWYDHRDRRKQGGSNAHSDPAPDPEPGSAGSNDVTADSVNEIR